MEETLAIKYLRSLDTSQLQQIAEDLQKETIEEKSPLRAAAMVIFNKDTLMYMIAVAVPLTQVLSERINSLGETIDGLNETIDI